MKVRRVTNVHSNWSNPGALEAGRQVFLPADPERRAEEALGRPTAEDGKFLGLIHDADSLYWDTQNEVLIFGNID